MNRIKKYNYEDIRKELPKYVVYIVDKNNEFHSILRTGNIKKKDLISFLETNYRYKPYEFFVVYKFSFHTGTKPLQGGPLSIIISSLVFDDNNKLVSGYTKDKKYKDVHGRVWFQRKFLEIYGWHNDYLDCMTKDLLDGKVHLLPLVVNMFNVDFPNCKIKEKPKTYTIKHEDMEIVKMIKQLKEKELSEHIDTKELKDKLKELENIKTSNELDNIKTSNKYNYEDIRKELPRYVVYIVDKNDKFHEVLRTKDKSKKEIITILENKYKNKLYEFFVVYKFGFHTGTKPLQGGPLSITISTLIFDDNNKLVSGYTRNKRYKPFHRKVWFQRKFLEEFGWHDDYLDCMTKDLLSGKANLLPLVVNMFNVNFPNCKIKSKLDNELDNELDIDDILKKYDKYYYYIANTNKTILLSSDDDLKQAQKEALLKLEPNIDNLINKNIILVSINNTNYEYNKNEKFNLIGGPIQIQLKYQIIKSKSKIINGDESSENIYLTNQYIKKNKTNLLVDLKKYVEDFKNNKLNSQKGIFNISKVKSKITNKANKKDKTNDINDVINLIKDIKLTKINDKIDTQDVNKLIKQLEEKKKITNKKSENKKEDLIFSDWLKNNEHLFSNRF